MGLKILGHLFTGPYEIESLAFRENQDPAIFAIVLNCGPAWDPVFRLVDIQDTGEDGLRLSNHPRYDEWISGKQGTISAYYISLSSAQGFDVAGRAKIMEEIRIEFSPPNDTISISGMV